MSTSSLEAATWPLAAAMLAGAVVIAGASWLWAERGLVIMLDLAGLAGSAFCL